MAKYDQGGGCACGLMKVCDCMGSMEEKKKHSKRIQGKKKARVRSVIAKELVTNPRYKQRVIKDKRGRKINLETYTFSDLVKDIQEE